MIEIESNIESTLTLTILRDCPNMTEPLQSTECPIQVGEQTISISIRQDDTISGILIQPLNTMGTIKLKNISFKKNLTEKFINLAKYTPSDTPQKAKIAEIPVKNVSPRNIKSILEDLDAPLSIYHVVFDSNDTCNADCVYCPNPRSNSLVEESDFYKLVNQKIDYVKVFQFGCGQEPTMDKRLPKFFEILNQSKLEPQKICMITNGTKLHHVNLQNLIDMGLSELQISIDTVDERINNMTRKNTNLRVIKENLKNVAIQYPDLSLAFSVVVNSLSINGIEDLINFGETINVGTYILREVWDFLGEGDPFRNNDYKKWMQNLALHPNEFSNMKTNLSTHTALKKIQFYPASTQEFIKNNDVK